eukprot:TRINITY_DN11323_c0_g1_i2.p1 TRINITY_DN11323_c0_g1~~TRINITY_DN11323_c0_g1_i2.p1  ORF type:complete len:183 (+),score=0.04 TRINITY_DN11323_c0_g1_i2:209-757(+)
MAKMSGSQLLAAFLLVSYILPALAEVSDVSAASPVTPSSSLAAPSLAAPAISSEATMPPASSSSPASSVNTPVNTPTANEVTPSLSTPTLAPVRNDSVSSPSSAPPDCSPQTIKAQHDICAKAPNNTCPPDCKTAYHKVKDCNGVEVAHMKTICSAAASISASFIIAAFFAVLATSVVNRLD